MKSPRASRPVLLQGRERTELCLSPVTLHPSKEGFDPDSCVGIETVTVRTGISSSRNARGDSTIVLFVSMQSGVGEARDCRSYDFGGDGIEIAQNLVSRKGGC